MPQFEVDEYLAAIIERLAKPKPFENLSFNSALWRVVREYALPAEQQESSSQETDPLDRLLADAMEKQRTGSKKAPTPNAADWVAQVPALKNVKGLNTWKTVCDHLKIDTAGDSARRKLQNWVKQQRPNWPPVPDTEQTVRPGARLRLALVELGRRAGLTDEDIDTLERARDKTPAEPMRFE